MSTAPNFTPVFVTIGPRGTMSLPAAIRRRFHLDRPGAQLQVAVSDDDVIELRPYAAVPADQAWFWAEEWQAGEREADEQIARGEGSTHLSGDDLIAAFEADR